MKTISILSAGVGAASLLLNSCVQPMPDSSRINPTAPATPSAGQTVTPKVAPTPAPPSTTAKKGAYPVANPVLDEAGKPKKNLFISPFPPYNPIDTTGFSSGELAGDPSTMKKNKKTGKPDKSTVKVFRLP